MLARRAIAPIVIALAIALVYWPGLSGFWTRDDYMQLAFARLVGSPWPVFVHDHYFPVPGSIFRPLGFASFWLWQALFGTDYFANAFGDMLLHVAVCFALYRVIRAGEIDRWPAVLCTLLFALHPAVIGTALWWSARFDLLATLFGLIAVRAALDYVQQPRATMMCLALAGLLAALLSKETALAAAVAILIVWLRAARLDRARSGHARRGLAALIVTVASFFIWRALVLGTLTTGLAGNASLVDAFGRGLIAWFSHLGGYLTFWPRSSIALAVLLFAFVFVELVDPWIKRDRGRHMQPISRSRADLFICGLCLFVMPAVLQAPVAAMNASALLADVSTVEAAMQSRLYYFSIAGLAIALAAFIGHGWIAARAARSLRTALLIACVAALAWVSHGVATAFAERTAAPRSMAESVAAAVDRAATTFDARCRIVVLGVTPPSEWSIYVSMDSVAKALSRDLDHVGRCFVEADYVTYFNLLRGDANPAGAAPYTPRVVNGHPLDWLRIGNMTAAYLDPPATIDAATIAGMAFLRYENGAFVDVTSDVASGRLAATLR